MADLEEANLLECGRCERLCAGAHPRQGASHCEKQACDQWVMKVGFLSRFLRAIRG